MQETEIDEGIEYTGFKEALSLLFTFTSQATTEELSLASCPGYVSAEDVPALVDSPSQTASLKDGFAVRIQDIAGASEKTPAELKLVGSVSAGGSFNGKLLPGETVKVCSGAPVPSGAGAVVSAELCDEEGDIIKIKSGVGKTKNIIPAGDDVSTGMTVIKAGEVILPARLALIAVAGISRLKVYRKPRVAIISIGDELIEPGERLVKGQIYASNAVNICSWLTLFNIPYLKATIADNKKLIRKTLIELSREADAVITNGGAMHSERDLTVGILDELGWDIKFRHVRMGPGKATAFGLWQEKPVLCFSGGPTSNGIAFLQFGLPAIFKMMGCSSNPLVTTKARLTRDMQSRNLMWTEFKQGRLRRDKDGELMVTPLSEKSRLKSMADADCLICKPEGADSLTRGQVIAVQLLTPTLAGASVSY